jgi:DNA-binding CsgD family transcriptional regulator
MILDTAMFYVLPHLEPSGPLLFVMLILGRLAVPGLFIFISLLMHNLTGIFQSTKNLRIMTGVSITLPVLFAGEYALSHGNHLPVMADLYAFSPVDFLYFPMILYPIIIFFIFSKRIKNLTLYALIRNFIIIILCALPFMLFEDIFGSVTVIFEFVSDNPLPLKLFPVYYLMVYLYLLYTGFKNVILERQAAGGRYTVTQAFIERYRITAREKEIILLMMEGAANKQIAEKLFISTATVRNHLHNIFEKTGVANRVELLRLASS